MIGDPAQIDEEQQDKIDAAEARKMIYTLVRQAISRDLDAVFTLAKLDNLLLGIACGRDIAADHHPVPELTGAEKSTDGLGDVTDGDIQFALRLYTALGLHFCSRVDAANQTRGVLLMLYRAVAAHRRAALPGLQESSPP